MEHVRAFNFARSLECPALQVRLGVTSIFRRTVTGRQPGSLSLGLGVCSTGLAGWLPAADTSDPVRQ
jgi:hypothetical protein